MKVLFVTPTYYPATYWGGPIFSTLATCNEMARHEDIALRVLTTDAAGPHVSDRTEVDTVPTVHPAGYEIFYCRRRAGRDISPELFGRLVPMVRWADLIHLTGNYTSSCLPTMLACRLFGRPLVWSPRGTLQASEEWASVRRPRAKKVFDWFVRQTLPRRTVMHLTAEIERFYSQKRIPGPATIVVPNGVEGPEHVQERDWLPDGQLRLVFLSRLDPKKGLEILLQAMKLLPDHVTLKIYGTGSADYVEQLRLLAHTLSVSKRVSFHGHVNGEAKRLAFESADLFVLPSHSENFGIVVAEALAHGVPVITSRATPWEAIETVGCGRWIDNTPEDVAAAVLELMDQDLAAMGERGRAYMARDFKWRALTDRIVDVYRSLVNDTVDSNVDLQSPDPEVTR